MSGTRSSYVGRFAPSPSGRLHFGSLVAALASWLDARARGGRWLVRIDDLDPPRTVPGAAEAILRTLAAFGLDWDGQVVFQGMRSDAYHAAVHALGRRGLVYPCGCSRREIADAGLHGIEGHVYPGTCRNGLHGEHARALRLDTSGRVVQFTDLIQGPQLQRIDHDVGDFVLYRADRVHAYHLAVAVDDAEQGVTRVVRGADLLDSTPRQILLQQLLGLPTPGYAHLPVAVNAEGQKLGKQTLAAPVDDEAPVAGLVRVLAFLGHSPPAELAGAPLQGVLDWSVAHWSLDRVPRRRQIAIEPA